MADKERENALLGLKYLHDVMNWSPTETESQALIRRKITKDAMELLKKQEPKTAIANPEKYGDFLRHCPSCEAVLPMSSQYGRAKFCHLCGQAVKWE